MSCEPKLTELVNALDDLPAPEVRYLCTKLGVDQCTLDKIDTDYRDALTRVPKYFQAWLDRDEQPSWASVAEHLKSTRLNKHVLARKIEGKYCSETCSVPTKCFRKTRRYSSSSDDGELSPRDVDLAASFPTPSPQYHDPPIVQQPSRQPTRNKSAASEPKYVNIVRKVSSLMKKFRSMVISANVNLTHKKMSPSDLYYFKVDLIELPMLTKYKKLRFLRRESRRILKAKCVEDVFAILAPYWNYVDYSLLEHIVRKYCDEKVRKQMRQYKHKLHKFEKKTTVKHLTSAVGDSRTLPSKYCTLTATLGIDAAECSLYHAREVKDSVAKQASLEPYVALLQGLHASAVVITIAFPRAARKHVVRSLDSEFLRELRILPESVSFNDSHSVRQKTGKQASHRSMENVSRSFWSLIPDISHSPALSSNDIHEPLKLTEMPPPPQNVREELTYTTRLSNLKPVYRFGPHLMKTYCQDIESKFQGQQLTIQFNWMPQQVEDPWKPHVVEFHITGFEDHITRAVHYIQQEFLVQRKEDATAVMSSSEESLCSHSSPLLTQEALQEHEVKSFSSEVRQFSCLDCCHVWWRVVSQDKPVSKCEHCHRRYDALPRDKEFGVGRFTCSHEACGEVFYHHCRANDERTCPQCGRSTGGPSVHPRNKKHFSYTPMHFFEFSTPHISTGSTVETWLSQTAACSAAPSPLAQRAQWTLRRRLSTAKLTKTIRKFLRRPHRYTSEKAHTKWEESDSSSDLRSRSPKQVEEEDPDQMRCHSSTHSALVTTSSCDSRGSGRSTSSLGSKVHSR